MTTIMTVESFLAQNPDASLKEYVNYVNEEKRIAAERLGNIKRMYNEWFNSKVGSYFLIDFNGYSKLIFQLSRSNDHASDKFVAKTAFCMFNDGHNINMSIESDRIINKLWLNNLYDDTIRTNSSVRKIYELSEFEYETYVRFFNDVKSLHNKCLVFFDDIEEERYSQS